MFSKIGNLYCTYHLRQNNVKIDQRFFFFITKTMPSCTM